MMKKPTSLLRRLNKTRRTRRRLGRTPHRPQFERLEERLALTGLIAFASDLNEPGNIDIYTMKSDGTSVQRLTTAAAADDFPAFSADGQKIAFTSDRDGNAEIYVMDADGSNQTRVTNNGALDLEPTWSPDGTQLAFASTRDGGDFDIFKLTLATSSVTQLTATPFTDSEPAWSPDGTQIAFISERNNINFFELFLMNTDGTSPAALLPGMTSVFGPSWSKDGSQLAFSKGISNFDEDLFIVDKSGTTGLLQLTTNSFVDRAPSWSPDGGQLAFERIGGLGNTIVTVETVFGGSEAQLTSGGSLATNPDWHQGPAPVNQVPTGVLLSNTAVLENEPTGTNVGTFSAIDPNAGDTHTFSLVSGIGDMDNARFVVAGDQLNTASVFDFETKSNYSIRVRATDQGSLSVESEFSINVTDVNEPPAITSNGSLVSVPENTTAVMTVTATDPDLGDTLTYAIPASSAGGVDRSRFTINSSSGALAFSSAPDFESPADANGDNDYELRVEVRDIQGLIDRQDVLVRVTDVNEPPVIAGGATAAINVPENTTAVTTLSVTDPDLGDTMTFSIIAGDDQTKFTLSSSGALAFSSAPDFESPADADKDNVYELRVEVRDSKGLVDTQDVSVTVTDVAEGETVYVNAEFEKFTAGDLIPDADPNTPGNQQAIYQTAAFANIQAGVNAATVDGRVLLTDTSAVPGKYNENIAIDKNVTIRATSTSSESVTVDGGGLGSVFVVSGATVALQGFVIQNGSATNGGGVRNSGGTLTLTNTVIQTNAASGDGGGIWSDGPLTLNGATISNNVSTGEGGGGIFVKGNLTIVGGSITGNSTTGDGGGVGSAAPSVDSTINISGNAQITGNKTTGNGGGVFVDQGYQLIIDGANVSNNQQQGIYAQNSALPINIVNATVNSNDDDGLFATGSGDVDIQSSTFNNNDADKSGSGDGIDLKNVAAVTGSNVTANGNDPGVRVSGASSFRQNAINASNNAQHGIWLTDIAGDVTLRNAILNDNDKANGGVTPGRGGYGFYATDGGDPDTNAIGGKLSVIGLDARDTDGAGTSSFQTLGLYVEHRVAGGAMLDGTTAFGITVLFNKGAGVRIEDAEVTVKGGNYSSNGGVGLSLVGAGPQSVADVTANNNRHGIAVAGSQVIVTNTTANANRSSNIAIVASSTTIVSTTANASLGHSGFNMRPGRVSLTDVTANDNKLGSSGLSVLW